ncbi:MAG TPA: phosphatidylinositol-specific phospholipase C1-like protein [Ohtaekwangia sp.]|uniref:phosphatidylinositol-specific phospholipase C1-like protein n=1 Tax=Ohtaekwangia sp. TaxID=2066019 RepID=UPI002F95F7FF
MKYTGTLLLIFSVLAMSCSSKKEAKHETRLNEIQFIGSHNSYKQAIDTAFFKLLLAKDSNVLGLDYHHLPLSEQLELGLRGLEIDVSHDPTGGRYQNPQGIAWAKQAGIILPPHDTAHILSQPGMKVLHVSDIDFRSSCLTFKNCLTEIKNWSDAHPDHTPILITINTKDSGLDRPDATKVLPFTAPVLDSLDAEVLSVLPESKLITPALVQGEAPTLREAILKNGWPTLDAVKGRIMFILDSPERIVNTYIANGKDRPMFVSVPETDPHAAFFILNEPVKQKEQIQALLKQNYMVRTRSDADTREARTNDYTRWQAAQASGAQLISTDYYLGKLSPTGTFEISFDGKYSRCNPVVVGDNCK